MKSRVYVCILASAYLSLLNGCATDEQQPISFDQPQAQPSINRPFSFPARPLSGSYADSVAVKKFIQHMVTTHGFDEGYLNNLFSQANRLPSVMRLENTPQYTGPKDAKPRLGSWTRYRKQFVNEAHIVNGVRFWEENADTIQQASNTYSVDPEYIVAIIGVETFYGRNVGNTCTFDALTTLAFDTPRRSKFFQEELENFLLMSKEEGYNPTKPVGSWAGAMGLGQFMPSSFRKLAVDFNRDGKRNLWHTEDAIGSVAHYFSRHGWQFKQPTVARVSDESDPNTFTLGASNGHEHWLAYPNFQVIKKYNNSNKYAMAVHQLAQAIKERR